VVCGTGQPDEHRIDPVCTNYHQDLDEDGDRVSDTINPNQISYTIPAAKIRSSASQQRDLVGSFFLLPPLVKNYMLRPPLADNQPGGRDYACLSVFFPTPPEKTSPPCYD
jgi:hypothetical protein